MNCRKQTSFGDMEPFFRVPLPSLVVNSTAAAHAASLHLLSGAQKVAWARVFSTLRAGGVVSFVVLGGSMARGQGCTPDEVYIRLTATCHNMPLPTPALAPLVCSGIDGELLVQWARRRMASSLVPKGDYTLREPSSRRDDHGNVIAHPPITRHAGSCGGRHRRCR